jgi:DNA-binding NtrC family response regulator
MNHRMHSRGRVLIVDHDAQGRGGLTIALRRAGFLAECAADAFKALHKIEQFHPHVVLTELRLPGLDGLDLMERCRASGACAAFLMMASRPVTSEVVAAVQRGALDFLEKPLSVEALAPVLQAAVQAARSIRSTAPPPPSGFSFVLGEHPIIEELRKQVALIAPSRASVLLEGESGTGKGLFAEAIHRCSPRAAGPFVRLSCAALTESLLESEIFGHEKGAFTGAWARRDGRFKQADGGTLFLDEVNDIPLPTQVKLLRFLQERTFERVGGNETLLVDVRVIAASNRSLEECVLRRTFRQDLYYRLAVVPLKVPPLRERASDIPLLAAHFLDRYATDNGKSIDGFSQQAASSLVGYPWPGNVRELENVIEHAVVICDTRVIEARHLPSRMTGAPEPALPPPAPGATLQALERWAIVRTLEACNGSTSRAAAILGISPRKIQYKIQEYGSNVRPMRPRSVG